MPQIRISWRLYSRCEPTLLKGELVLTLLNYIRDSTTPILDSFQHCCQTPSKANHPSKYDYFSPVKKYAPSPKIYNPSLQLSNRRKGINLEDRFESSSYSTPKQRKSFGGSSTTPSGSGSGRGGRSGGRKTPNSLTTTPELHLGDFITVSSGKKQSQKVRKSSSMSDIQKQQQPKTLQFSPGNFPSIDETMESSGKKKKKAVLIPVNRDETDFNPAFMADSPTIAAKTPNKTKENISENVVMTTTPVRKPNDSSDSSSSLVIPDPREITHKNQLDKLITLYCFVLDRNLVPNILVELYLLCELLTVQCPSPYLKKSKENNYLDSVHNCIYFASSVFKNQAPKLLRHVDRVTIRFLIDNPRIETFNGDDFKTLLIDIYQEKKSQKLNLINNDDEIIGSVRFQCETDNRSNFPDNKSFNDFKKQRDLFYEILRIWENQRDGNWHFGSALGEKIMALLHMHSHPVNLIHFARLFQSQLVSMCGGSGNSQEFNEAAAAAAALDEMQELKKTDPVKYRKLQSRLTTPSMFGGPCPNPGFPGPQEFFRDFIKYCNHHQFIGHLKDNISGTIGELNKYSFSLMDNIRDIRLSDNNEEDNDNLKIQNEFSSTLMTCRILAKFLGYIESLPYSCPPDSVTEDMIVSETALRKYSKPSIDLIDELKDGISQRRIVLIVPWIVEFCSVLDPISIHLPYYHKLFDALIAVYRQLTVDNSTINRLNSFFLRVNLGWLFESALFPRELLINKSSTPELQNNNSLLKSLDESDVITESLMYKCCPYLSELKVILSSFLCRDALKVDISVNSSPANIARKIIPISTNTSSSADFNKNKTSSLQRQMEENFFHNQPTSVKKSVDFVSERVASNAIKALRVELVNEGERKKTSSLIHDLLSREVINKEDKIAVERLKSELSSKIPTLAEESWKIVRAKGPEFVTTRVAEPIESSLRHLLAEDTEKVIFDITLKITVRKTIETASNWIDEHVALSNLFIYF